MNDRGGAPIADVRCADAVNAGIRRVLDLGPSTPVRGDTPLHLLGLDSLALLCLADVLGESGWHLDEARARAAGTVADLTAACSEAA